jgi:DNA-directed RNA polymerase subunit alpha
MLKNGVSCAIRLTAKNATHDEKVITAADIRIDSPVKILNPEIQLATHKPRTELQLEVYVELGEGIFRLRCSDSRDGQQDGMLYVDAAFSPVTAVEFSVEPTRVGRRTDFDKLTIEIWTNGSNFTFEALGHGTKD